MSHLNPTDFFIGGWLFALGLVWLWIKAPWRRLKPSKTEAARGDGEPLRD